MTQIYTRQYIQAGLYRNYIYIAPRSLAYLYTVQQRITGRLSGRLNLRLTSLWNSRTLQLPIITCIVQEYSCLNISGRYVCEYKLNPAGLNIYGAIILVGSAIDQLFKQAMTFNQAPMILLIPTILSLDRAWPMIFHLTIAVILWLPNIV